MLNNPVTPEPPPKASKLKALKPPAETPGGFDPVKDAPPKTKDQVTAELVLRDVKGKPRAPGGNDRMVRIGDQMFLGRMRLDTVCSQQGKHWAVINYPPPSTSYGANHQAKLRATVLVGVLHEIVLNEEDSGETQTMMLDRAYGELAAELERGE